MFELVRRRAQCALLICLSAAILIGCGGHGAPTGVQSGALKERAGAVSLSLLAQANPDWLLVEKTDQAIRRYQGFLGVPVPAAGAGVISGVALPAMPKAALPLPVADQAAENAHLQKLSERQIARLWASLQAAEAERLDADGKVARAQSDQEFQSGRSLIDARYLVLESAIAGEDSAKVLNLTVQVEALQADAAWPVTAPDDYWGKLAAQKEAQLAAATTDRAKQLGLAQAARDAELASLRAHQDKQVSDTVQEARDAIERENFRMVDARKQGLEKQKQQVLGMSRRLAAQMNAQMLGMATARSTAASVVAIGQPAGVSAGIASDLQQWRARLGETIALLQRQRARQAVLVSEETRRSVFEIARQNGLRIVGWQGGGSARDLTPLVLQELRKERWGQT